MGTIGSEGAAIQGLPGTRATVKWKQSVRQLLHGGSEHRAGARRVGCVLGMPTMPVCPRCARQHNSNSQLRRLSHCHMVHADGPVHSDPLCYGL